jgi:hypothetical protein
VSGRAAAQKEGATPRATRTVVIVPSDESDSGGGGGGARKATSGRTSAVARPGQTDSPARVPRQAAPEAEGGYWHTPARDDVFCGNCGRAGHELDVRLAPSRQCLPLVVSFVCG